MMLALLQRLRRLADGTGIGRLPGVAAVYRWVMNLVHPSGITQISTADFPLWINASGGGLHQILLEQGVYEPETTEIMKEIIKPGMTILDIGANIGYFSMLFGKRVGPTGRIVCFEPAPENVDLLKRNIDLNKLDDRMTVVASCVGDSNNPVTLHLDSTNQGNHSLSQANVVTEKSTINVPCTTIDTYLTAHPLPHIDLLKMDVQGAELQVLHGMTVTLNAHPKMSMVMEYWPFGLRNTGANPADVLTILRKAGYHFRDIEHMDEPIDQLTNEQLIARCDAKRSGKGWVNLLAQRNV